MEQTRKYESWNPLTGCVKISPGCLNCYAERFALRLQGLGVAHYKDGFALTLRPERLDLPRKWRKPRYVFVNSMSDLFQEGVEFEFIRQVFAVMRACPRHIFQVLTKRSARLAELAPRLPWPANVWAGVTVERRDYFYRLNDLRLVPAALRFMGAEPLLGSLEGIDLSGISWVVAGGECAPRPRLVKREWIEQLREACRASGAAFYFKQWGGSLNNKSGNLLDGKIYEEMPELAPMRPSLV